MWATENLGAMEEVKKVLGASLGAPVGSRPKCDEFLSFSPAIL